MAVSTTDTFSGPYEANGVTVEFPFTFKALEADDVVVLLIGPDGAETILAPAVYVVTILDQSGSVRLNAAPTAGQIYILSEPAFSQQVNFASGQPFLPAVVNAVNDRAVMRDLVLRRDIRRSIALPIGEEGLTLPRSADRALKYLGFDEAGRPIASPGVGDPEFKKVIGIPVASTDLGDFDEGIIPPNQKVKGAFQSVEDALSGLNGIVSSSVEPFKATQGQTVFPLPFQLLSAPVVYVEGYRLADDEFSHSATAITLAEPCDAGWDVLVVASEALIIDNKVRASDLAAPTGGQRVGFKQIGVGAVGEDVETALRRLVWVDQFKLAIDADDTQSIIRAIASGASRLMFQDRDYMVSGPIIVPGLKFLVGDLVGCTRIVQTNMASDLLRFVMAFAQAGGLSHITLTSDVDVFGGRGSTGVALTIDNPNDNFVCSDFEVVSYDKQILVKGAYQPHFRDFRCLFFTDYAVKLEAYAAGYEIAGSQWQSGKISNLGFAESGYDSIGIWGRQASGEFFRDIDIPMVGRGVVLDPPANSWARFVRFANVLADSCYYEGWTFDGGAGGYVVDIECLGCWSAGSGGGAYRPAGSDRGAGLLTKGIALDDVRWALGTLRDNDCGGADLQGGTNIRFTETSIARNSRRLGFNNIYPGVRVRAGVLSWGIHNSVIGNFAQGVFDIQQAESVVIDVGASTNFAITDSDLSNPGPGKQPFVNGSTSSNYVLSGNRPRRAVGLNASERQVLSSVCEAAIASGTFAYLGPNGTAPDAFSSVHIMQHPGVLAKAKIAAPAAPGAGQFHTYTVYLNGAPTGMTGTIAGSALTAELTSAFLFNEGDLICVRVASTAGATPVRHNIALVVEP